MWLEECGMVRVMTHHHIKRGREGYFMIPWHKLQHNILQIHDKLKVSKLCRSQVKGELEDESGA